MLYHAPALAPELRFDVSTCPHADGEIESFASLVNQNVFPSQISVSSARNLLQLPFLGELLIQLLQVLHNIGTGLDDGLLGRQTAVCLYSELEVGEQRMRYSVRGEDDLWRFDESAAEEIAECVVFFLEEED